MTEDGSPCAGAEAAPRVDSRLVLVDGDLPASLNVALATLACRPIPVGASQPHPSSADLPTLAICGDPATTARWCSMGVGLVLGLAAKGDLHHARRLFDAGACDILFMEDDASAHEQRLALALLRAPASVTTFGPANMDRIAALAEHLASDAPTAIPAVIESVAKWMSAERVIVIEEHLHHHTDAPVLTAKWDYLREGSTSLLPQVSDSPIASLPETLVRLRATLGKGLPQATASDGGRELLAVPVSVEGNVWGALVIETARPGTWAPFEFAIARAAAAGIGGFMSRLGAIELSRRRDERFRDVFDYTNDMIYMTDLDMRFTSANPAVERVLGYRPEEIIGRSIDLLVDAETQARARESLLQKLEGDTQATTYPIMMIHKDGHTIPAEVRTRLTYRDGVAVGTQGIARDVSRHVSSERRLREQAEELVRSEAAFRTLFDKSPQPMIVHDDVNVRILEVNESACRVYGWTREEFLGLSLLDLHPQDQPARPRGFFDGHREEVEDLGVTRHRTKSGTLIDVHIHTRTIDFKGQEGRVAIIEDVTARVRSEAALRRALKMNDNIMASASDVILSTDTNGIIAYANQRTFEATGYEPVELIGRPLAVLSPEGATSTFSNALAQAVETGVSHIELEVQRKDGSVLWFKWGVAPLLEDGENLGAVACGHNITPQREAEAEIQRLASVVAQSANAIITASADGMIVGWNGAGERLFGISEADAIGLPFSELLPKHERATAENIIRQVREGASLDPIGFHILRRDGSRAEISATAFPILSTSGEFAFAGIIARDVTEQREATREIAQMSAVVQASTEAIITTDLAGQLTNWNAAAERIFGYTKSEVLGRGLAFLLPPDQGDRGREIGKRLIAGKPVEGFELTAMRKDRTTLLIDFTAFPVRDAAGRVTSLAGIIRDITVQRANEDSDRERQEVLSLAYRALSTGIFVTSEDGVIQSANDEACNQFGRTRDELVGMLYWKLLPQAAWATAEELHRGRMQSEAGTPGQIREWPVVTPAGESRVMTSVTGRFDLRDGRRCLVVAGTDITARKAAEAELASLAAIVASSGDAMVSADLEGRIVTWNRGAEQLFGWPAEEALGQPLGFFYPDGARDDGKAAIELLKRGARIDGVETRAVTRSGETIDVSISLFGVRDGAGKLVSVAGVGRDVSEQKRMREELQRRVAHLQSLYRLRVRLAEAESDLAILEAGLDALTDVLGPPVAAVRLTAEDGSLHFVATRGGLSRPYQEWVHKNYMPTEASAEVPLSVENVELWDSTVGLREIMLEEGIRAFVRVPLAGLNQPFGAILGYYHEPHEFSAEELEISQTVAGSVAFALEQRAAKAALQRSIERFEAVSAATQDAIWDLDIASRRIWWSSGFESMFNYPPEEIEGSLDYWERLIHPDDRTRVQTGFYAAIENGDSFWSDEYRFRRADGTYADIFDRGSIVKNEFGESGRIVGSMVDITALRNAENELRERERFLGAIIDHSPLGIQVFGPDGTSLRMNGAVQRFLGLADTSVGIGEFNPLTDPYMVSNGQSAHFALAYQGDTVELRDEYLDPRIGNTWELHAQSQWFDQWLFPVKDDEGNVTAVVSMVNDVGERHQSQEDLRTAQRYLQSVISNAPLLMFVWDREGNFMMAAGAAVAGLLGDDPKTGFSTNAFHLFADQPDIISAVGAGLEGESTSFEMEYNGCIWEAKYTPMRDERGEITGVIGVSTDVTDRKRAEMARGVAEQRLLAVAESLPIIFFALDREGCLTLANGKGLGTFTDDPASLIGRPLFDQIETTQFDAAVVRALKGESFTAVTPIGEQWYETHFEPITDKDGSIAGTIGVSLDITERRKTEEALLQSQKLESLGILAGGIAHDFNNLLVGIMGNAGLALMELPPDSAARDTIEEIEMAGQRAAELARQMLAYSGKGRFVVQRIDLSSLVEEMTQLLRVSISKSALLDYHFEASLPSVEVDTTQLRQVVMNLVINASDAIGDDDGRITVTTGLMYADRDYLSDTYLPQDIEAGEYVYLEVADTGKGMDAETRGRVFDPFFTTKFTGRGLGLAAVLGIVRGHRGAIKVTSEPGRGTRFRLLLPSAGPLPETASPAGSSRTPRVWRANGTILLADDEATVRNVTARALESFGFKTIRAVDGQDAVDLFQKHRAEISCVLMDLTMPRLNGEDALAAIRGIDPYVRVVLMSGYAEQEAMGRFAGKGLAGFIQKPYEVERLRQTLRAVLESPPPNAAEFRQVAGA